MAKSSAGRRTLIEAVRARDASANNRDKETSAKYMLGAIAGTAVAMGGVIVALLRRQRRREPQDGGTA